MKNSLLNLFLLLAILTSLTAGTLAVYANVKSGYEKQATAKLSIFTAAGSSTASDTREIRA